MVNPKKRLTARGDDDNEEVTREDAQEAEDDNFESDTISAELNSLVATYISDHKDEIP